jgi:hypothetical protein
MWRTIEILKGDFNIGRTLTVFAESKPDAFLTAWLIVLKYVAVSDEYSFGVSSKNMPCRARPIGSAPGVGFVAHPEYVATSRSTAVMFLVAKEVRTYPIVRTLGYEFSFWSWEE